MERLAEIRKSPHQSTVKERREGPICGRWFIYIIAPVLAEWTGLNSSAHTFSIPTPISQPMTASNSQKVEVKVKNGGNDRFWRILHSGKWRKRGEVSSTTVFVVPCEEREVV